jgi:hypothetical protein
MATPSKPLIWLAGRAPLARGTCAAAGARLCARPPAVGLAARIGDGYISTAPDAGMVRRHLSEGGKGQAGFLEFYRREVLPRLG